MVVVAVAILAVVVVTVRVMDMVMVVVMVVVVTCVQTKKQKVSVSWLVKLPTHTPKDILNGNNRQLRGRKGNAVHQETTNCVYMINRTEIPQRTDRETFEILVTQYSRFENIVLRT